MSTHFLGEGNIGSAPEHRTFANGNEAPRHLLRLNVYFDNPVLTKAGYEDRGGYWAPVELWHPDAEHWSTLYQKGMRVLIEGRTVKDEWEDSEQVPHVTFKIEARRVGILPYRLDAISLSSKPNAAKPSAEAGAKAEEADEEEQAQQSEPAQDNDNDEVQGSPPPLAAQ